MKKLIIKVGGNMMRDIREVFRDPKKAVPGSHTLHLKNAGELYEILSPKRIELLKYVISNPNRPIKTLSKTLKRKQESISRDAGILAKHSIIIKSREKQTTLLHSPYGSLEVVLSE